MSVATASKRLVAALKENHVRVVFAESCTAGLVAASLARHAGISEFHCGSAVTYRNETKINWLGVSPSAIAEFTEVSEAVARQMAIGVLANTPEAAVAASVTGHLGPNAPGELDGVIFIGLAERENGKSKSINVRRVKLQNTSRLSRQREAAEYVLDTLSEFVSLANGKT